jgi:hypothetical protein
MSNQNKSPLGMSKLLFQVVDGKMGLPQDVAQSEKEQQLVDSLIPQEAQPVTLQGLINEAAKMYIKRARATLPTTIIRSLYQECIFHHFCN